MPSATVCDRTESQPTPPSVTSAASTTVATSARVCSRSTTHAGDGEERAREQDVAAAPLRVGTARSTATTQTIGSAAQATAAGQPQRRLLARPSTSPTAANGDAASRPGTKPEPCANRTR